MRSACDAATTCATTSPFGCSRSSSLCCSLLRSDVGLVTEAPRRGIACATCLVGQGACLFDFDSYDPRGEPPPSVGACPEPGATEDCYAGPDDTLGVGTCTAGSRICEPSGWSACEGQVRPRTEDCIDGVDDDCDGDVDTADADCQCAPGELIDCYDGPDGTLDVGRCGRGKTVCGDANAACLGQALPALERCGNGEDDDCDGTVDEDCATWSSCFRNSGTQEPLAAVVGTNGNVTITGILQGTANLGAGAITSSDIDVLVAKFAPDGSTMWSQAIGGNGGDIGWDVAIGTGGDILVAGSYRGTFAFAGTPLLPTVAGDSAMMALVFSAGGNPQRVLAPEEFTGRSEAHGVSGKGGDAYLVGTLDGSFKVDGTEIMGSTGMGTCFILRFSKEDLGVEWGHAFNGPGDCVALKVATASNGDAFVLGQYSVGVDVLGTNLSSAGGDDAFVARVTTAGTLDWATPLAATGNVDPLALSVKGQHVVIGGSYAGTMTVDATELPPALDEDSFVLQLNGSTGALQWHRTVTDIAGVAPRRQRVMALAADGDHDRIWASVAQSGTVDYQGQVVVSAGETAANRDDLVLWLLDGNGETQRVQRFGDAWDQEAFGLGTLSDGGVVIAAGVEGSIDFGPGLHRGIYRDEEDLCVVRMPPP